ncbi:hypothetical protein DCC62_12145 [candidate division KSB1 bacterium]|nr:MAG: hypothetical protein DCC62_12145 [candidate division KSB1 bacterium]
MQPFEVFIPLGAFAMLAFIIVQFFYHRQRMKLIERGLATTDLPPMKLGPGSSLKFGLIAISQIFEELFRGWGGEDTFAMGSIFVGAALIIHTLIDRKASKAEGESVNNL